MLLGELITNYRREHKLSQRQFAEICGGITNGYISMLENNRNPSTDKPIIPSLDKLKAIARGMNISLQALLEQADDMPVDIAATGKFQDAPPTASNLTPIDQLPRHRVPLIGSIAAGKPIVAETQYDIYVDSPAQADYALTVEGDSMEPLYLNGDVVYIRELPDVDDGRVAVVILDDTAVLKHVYHIENGLLLVSENPKYPPRQATFNEYSVIRILGTVVGYTRMYKKPKA